MTDSKISSGHTKARRGVSLIEVLVVLVILVTGILVIIRLYPSGFFSVQSVGNAAVADSLGAAELQAANQDASSLPEAILPTDAPIGMAGMDANGNLLLPASGPASAAYDPEFNEAAQANYSTTLNRGSMILNETVTIPAASGNPRQSVYVVKYGPIVMGASPTPEFLSVKSSYWTPVNANPNGLTAVPAFPADPQDELANVAPQSFLIDLKNQKIAVPYAPYALTDPTTTPPTYTSYDQKMIVVITGSDGNPYTQYLNVRAGLTQNATNPRAPKDGKSPEGYLPDTSLNYHGGWFDPTASYDDGANAHKTLPSGVTWASVALYRPFSAVADLATLAAALDPYTFTLTTPTFGTSNLGGMAFNTRGAGRAGANALKARISYRVADWRVIHEDRDVPSLSGTNTSVLRLSLKNLKRAGDEGPNNTIDPGLLSSGHSMYILDLDTGMLVAPSTTATDPTNPDLPIVDEDVLGTDPGPKNERINASFAIGRLTFGSNAFGDNSSPADGTGTAPAHRIRIFYSGDLNWTVAIQKAPAYYVVDNQAQVTANGGILPGHCYYDANTTSLLFPQSDAGKTVEVDGSPDQPGQTAAIGDAVTNMGGVNYVSLPYSLDATKITAVRGLSARAIVAWQERGQWKSHSVDTILNRTP